MHKAKNNEIWIYLRIYFQTVPKKTENDLDGDKIIAERQIKRIPKHILYCAGLATIYSENSLREKVGLCVIIFT